MAISTESKNISVAIKLNNGTTSSGQPKTLSVNLGSLNKTAFDAQKAINIISALGPCFVRTLHSIEKTEVSYLNEE